ncbi:PREDICTED: zinc finger MYND domain-containing protein 12-like isoform X1 [Amphimedon queenslandica]|uniref:MYND-type domain-containing protein n=1 Tax=Amphimedon queenslandica TaxID=400682 RepID=A0AAN0J422_AMPQE|nr:PREDICTED: zinc finger MYND domain-containing protein 12-like isoform X1 [Amphimedon queenslandica]|eukprot:XP_019851502.1 PREDICTED: zinc finger MYND domain-containing protein 12-like isoform X1 [Amphimedon queenslandica]
MAGASEEMEDGFEVNPLANPKGIKLSCHLCQKPARIQCPSCRSTYYCVDDQLADWRSIHSQVCSLIASLKPPETHANSDTERKQRKKHQQQTRDRITEMALTEARKHLHNEDYTLAFPPSLLALKLLTDTHGPAHLELTPALLLLAQSSLGQDQLRNAEKFLSQAHWTVLQNSQTSASLHSQLHRNLGLLAAAREEYLMAKKHFAEDIYQSSIAYGTQSIKTVGGLFQLGNIFLKEDKPVVAQSFFNEVIKIWLIHLDGIIQEMIKALQTPPSTFALPGTKDPLDSIDTMNVAERVEARQQLQTVLSLQEIQSPSFAYKACFTLSLLHVIMKEYPQSLAYIDECTKIKTGSSTVIEEREFEVGAETTGKDIEILVATLREKEMFKNDK